jgi:CRP-like cAMP-binding protein
MAHPVPQPSSNRLLASLTEAELAVIEPKLQSVQLPAGKRLYETDEEPTHVYFPTQGIVSVLYVDDRGASSELTLVGCEGAVGLSVLLGGGPAMIPAVVQTAGHAYRFPAMDARASFAQCPGFRTVILRFVHALIFQVAQSAVCNLHHSVEQQLCRWLLLCLDRMPGNQIHMTHEMIASMLGVRRQGVTEAAKRLERGRVISYFRGHITVLDRHALEQSSCECYRILKRQTEPFLSDGDPIMRARRGPLSPAVMPSSRMRT